MLPFLKRINFNIYSLTILFKTYSLFLILPYYVLSSDILFNDSSYISTNPGVGQFRLYYNGKVAPIFISSEEYTGVVYATRNLQKDIKEVTGKEPRIFFDSVNHYKEIVIIGTIGKNKIIDEILKNNNIDTSVINGKWESYIICVIDKPIKNVDRALIIVGSDKRGTIYGIYDLSEKIGVSPWYWWADVPIKKKKSIFINSGVFITSEPKVKYRGIFINDEAPALTGWAYEKFGGFNHKFYTKVFELILRLKGNFLWPAMWGKSFFTDDTLNPKLADEYGVVIGTSHHEPLMRAHVEWGKGPGTWNYQINEDTLKIFWSEGIKRMKNYESIITLGMRGDGDEPMTDETNIELLQRIVRDQRKIITDVTGKEITSIPQVWALYKEVQDYYDKGMRVPDDVILLLCDDNWGNIRKLPKLNEKPHPGGYGIYYHFDYVGDPRNYKWLNTNQISRVWEQMKLAYEYGVDKIWIVNVGDIKPMEFPIHFFLTLAWNPDKINAEDLLPFTFHWSENQFGKKYAKDIAEIINDYTRYNSRRKPELLSPNTYSLIHFREFERVVDDYNKLLVKAEKIYKLIPPKYKDAYFQLVLHPVKACANLNEMYYWTGKNHLYAQQGRIKTNKIANLVYKLFKKDSAISYYYNKVLSNGKWNHMMDQTHISYSYWQQPEKDTVPKTEKIKVLQKSDMGVALEGSDKALKDNNDQGYLPEFDVFNDQKYYIEIFNLGTIAFNYKILSENPCIIIDKPTGKIIDEKRVFVSIDWNKAPIGKNLFPVFIYGPKNKKITVFVPIFKISDEEKKNIEGYVESNGYISIEAEKYQREINSDKVKWLKIPFIGRTLSGVSVTPSKVIIDSPGNSTPHLEYDLYLFSKGEVTVKVYLSPTINFLNNIGLRYAVSIDNEPPQIINIHSNYDYEKWKKYVADNINIKISKHKINSTGKNTLKFWLVDPGIVLQKIVIETSEEKPCYLGPPESVFIN